MKVMWFACLLYLLSFFSGGLKKFDNTGKGLMLVVGNILVDQNIELIASAEWYW